MPLLLLLKNPQILIALAATILLVSAYYIGYNNGKQKAKIQTIEKVVYKREKQIDIRNNRPDDAGVIKRMQERTF